MIWFLILFIIVDIIQVLYIKHLKKEIAFRDGEEAKDDEPVIRRKQSDKADKGSVLDLTAKKDCRSSPKRCGLLS